MTSQEGQPQARKQGHDSQQGISAGGPVPQTISDYSLLVSTDQVWLRDCREDYVVQTTSVYVLQGASGIWHRGRVIQQVPMGIIVEWPDHPLKPNQAFDKRSRQLLRADPLDADVWDLNASNGNNWVLTAAAWERQMHTDALQLPLSSQALGVALGEPAMSSLSGGGDAAEAASAAPAVFGSPRLGESASQGPAGLGSQRLGQGSPPGPLSAMHVAAQALWHADRALRAANAAAVSAKVYFEEKTAAHKALGALQALSPAFSGVPLTAATPGAVNGHGSRELLTQALVGHAAGVASTSSLSAAPLPILPPPDLAAMAAAARDCRQHLPAVDELPSSSQQAAAGPPANLSPANADRPRLSAAKLPSVDTRRTKPFATGRSGAAQPLLPVGHSPRTPNAAVQMKTARDIRRRAWQSTRHAQLQSATDDVGNVAAEELAAGVPAAMPGYGELHPVGGPQAAAAEGAAAAESGAPQQDMQPSVEDVAMLEELAARRDEGVDAEQPLPAVQPQPLIPRQRRTHGVGLRKRVRVVVPPGTPTAWYATQQGSTLPQRVRSCYALPLSFGAPQSPRGPAFASRNLTNTRLSSGVIAEHSAPLFSAEMRQCPRVKTARPVSAAAEAGAAVLQELAASLAGHCLPPHEYVLQTSLCNFANAF